MRPSVLGSPEGGVVSKSMVTHLAANRLAGPLLELATSAPIVEAVERAAVLFDDALVGVVLYGSFARGEMRAGSDVDLLIVLDAAVPLTRSLYRVWDERPSCREGGSVDAHFAHLPAAGARLSGFWAEIARDGIVIRERGLAVSSRLSELRRELLDGRLERRIVHGQPCWVDAA